MVLFLNFDGVLHPNAVRFDERRQPLLDAPGHCLFESSPILEQLTAEFADLRLILNTWWTYWLGLDNCLRKLPDAVSSRVVGAILPHETECATLPHRINLATGAAANSEIPPLIVDHADARYPKHVIHMTLLLEPKLGLADPHAVSVLHDLLARSHLKQESPPSTGRRRQS